jgi:hypothetical protein
LPQTQADWNSFLAQLNQWAAILQQESHAPNVIPSQLQTFTVAASAAVIAALSATNCTPSVDNSQQYYGAASLKVAIASAGATLALAGYPISIAPASRWFAAFQVYAPAGCTGSLTITTSAGHSVTEAFTVPAAGSWQQVWGLFDLRPYADTQATWKFTFTSTATVWLDGLQMNAVGSPIGKLPKFAGSQMVTGILAYQSNLDGVPNGPVYGRTRGGVLTNGIPSASAGKNWLVNPGFESNIVGTPLNAGLSAGGSASDGWTINVQNAPGFFLLESNGNQRSGAKNLYVTSAQNGQTIGANAVFSYRAYSPQLPVKGGSTLYYGGWRNLQRNQVPPAGVAFQVRIGVLLYDTAGALLLENYPADMTAPVGWGEAIGSVAVPSNATYVVFECAAFTLNTNATSVLVPNSGSIGDARFDDCWLYETVDSDNELADGTIYWRFKSGYMDGSRRVNTVQGGIAPLGSIPTSSFPSVFAYASTPTSITVSWTALTLYRIDGTTTSIAAGNITVTGLTASTTYSFYPYVRESDATVQLATGGANSAGSPAAAYTAASAQGFAISYAQANSPLPAFTASTPASGGGGGGLNKGCCLHGSQLIELADGSEILARDLTRAHRLTSPEGSTPVASLRSEAWGEWFRVTPQDQSFLKTELFLAGDHRFIDPSGEQVCARDLRLQQVLQAEGGYVRVVKLEAVWEPGDKVSVEVGHPHTYYVQGILAHNKVLC